MQFDLLFLNESGVVMLRWNECTKKMKVNANILLINPQEGKYRTGRQDTHVGTT